LRPSSARVNLECIGDGDHVLSSRRLASRWISWSVQVGNSRRTKFISWRISAFARSIISVTIGAIAPRGIGSVVNFRIRMSVGAVQLRGVCRVSPVAGRLLILGIAAVSCALAAVPMLEGALPIATQQTPGIGSLGDRGGADFAGAVLEIDATGVGARDPPALVPNILVAFAGGSLAASTRAAFLARLRLLDRDAAAFACREAVEPHADPAPARSAATVSFIAAMAGARARDRRRSRCSTRRDRTSA
jgi:hypothetical protein